MYNLDLENLWNDYLKKYIIIQIFVIEIIHPFNQNSSVEWMLLHDIDIDTKMIMLFKCVNAK